MTVIKATAGNFFQDFRIGQVFHHATPRTITAGDASLYIGLTGSRFLLNSSVEAARKVGFKGQLVDDVLLFHIAFGKTVQDISLNAVANLGYADVRFLQPVYVGDTIAVQSEVIGLRENKNGKSGIVYVQSIATNQYDEPVLTWQRWVMVHKADSSADKGAAISENKVPDSVPKLAEQVDISQIKLLKELDYRHLNFDHSGSQAKWQDYQIGEMIDHQVGMTIDDTDHTLATKLYQNNARVHFDAVHMQQSQFKQRLMYGGHVISICRALSFNGLANALQIIAINGGSHTAPTFAGDTLYAASEVLAKQDIAGRDDVAVLRLKTLGIKNQPLASIQDSNEPIYNGETKRYHPSIVLALDYSVLIPK
jgi:2-methylfumaryl-CoA hydratase